MPGGVRRAAHPLQAGVGQQFHPGLEVLAGHQLVLVGLHHQGAAADAAEPPRQLAVVARVPGEPGEGAGLGVALHHRLDVVRVEQEVRVVLGAAVVEQLRDVLGRHAEQVRQRVAGDAQPDRGDQGEAGQPLRVEHPQFGSDPAAEREADQVDLVEGEGVQQVAVVQHQVVEALDPVRQRRAAEAGMLRRHEVHRGGHTLVEGQPQLGGAGAVEEHGRRPLAPALAFAPVGDGEAVHLDPLRFGVVG